MTCTPTFQISVDSPPPNTAAIERERRVRRAFKMLSFGSLVLDGICALVWLLWIFGIPASAPIFYFYFAVVLTVLTGIGLILFPLWATIPKDLEFASAGEIVKLSDALEIPVIARYVEQVSAQGRPLLSDEAAQLFHEAQSMRTQSEQAQELQAIHARFPGLKVPHA